MTVPAMRILPLQTEIGDGKDKQVDVLFEGPRRKLVQITLRRSAILNAHKAPVPIAIHCIAGQGAFTAGGQTVELQPGVLITLGPDIVHEVAGQPSVSILLTQFKGDGNTTEPAETG